LGKTALRLILISDSYSDTSEEEERRAKKERREKDVVMEISLDVVMEKTSLEEKTSLSTQVGPTDPAA
jgi:hypothetical protein